MSSLALSSCLFVLALTSTPCMATRHHTHEQHTLSMDANVYDMNEPPLTEHELEAVAAQKRDAIEWSDFLTSHKISIPQKNIWADSAKYLSRVGADAKPVKGQKMDFQTLTAAYKKYGPTWATISTSIAAASNPLPRLSDKENNKQENNKQQKKQLLLQLQSQIMHASTVDATPPTAPIVDLFQTRQEARGGAADPVGLANNYIRDAVGRVTEVGFYVTFVPGGGGPIGPSDAYCDAVFNPYGYPASPSLVNRWHIQGEARSRIPADYERGHIWGSQLGGSDADPLNFFPQHRRSNRDNSAWWRIEQIAAETRWGLDQLPAVPTPMGGSAWTPAIGGPAVGTPWPAGACPLVAYIRFAYAGPNPALATHGDYELRTPSECYAALVFQVNAGAIIRYAYLDAFLNPAGRPTGTQAVGAVATQYNRPPSHALVTTWFNAPDMCIQNPIPALAPGAGPALVIHPEYRVCDHLYA